MCHVKRRSVATQVEINYFIKRIRYVITHSNMKQVLNVDESFCKTNQIFNFTCAHKRDDELFLDFLRQSHQINVKLFVLIHLLKVWL